MTRFSDAVWPLIRSACTDHMLPPMRGEPIQIAHTLPDAVTELLAGKEDVLSAVSARGEDGILGSFSTRRSPAKITLHLDNLRVYFWQLVERLLSGERSPLTDEQIRQLADATVYVTLLHERFHDFCDLTRHSQTASSVPRQLDVLREEALAVAMSWYGLHLDRSAYGALTPEIWDAFVEFRFNYQGNGYKDWPDLSHYHVFADELDQYLGIDHLLKTGIWDSPNKSSPYVAVESLYSLPNWNIQTVDFDLDPQPHGLAAATAALATLRAAERNPKSTSLSGSVPEVSREPPHVPPYGKRHVICRCEWPVDSLPISDAMQTLKLPVRSVSNAGARVLCLYGAPLRSHALGLLKIPNLRRVVLFHKEISILSDVSDIVNSHFEFGEDGVIDCQHELIESGLTSYAEA